MSKVLVSKIAGPYADALLELAKSKNIVDKVTTDISDLLTLFVSVPELTSYLGNPVVSPDKKKELLKKVMDSMINPETLKFLQFLIDRRRIKHFDAIGEKFLQLVWALEGIKIVKFQTVIPLSYKQEEDLISQLKEFTGSKEIRLIKKIDKSILGGLVLQIDSQVIDISLKGQLRQISNNLESNLVI